MHMRLLPIALQNFLFSISLVAKELQVTISCLQSLCFISEYSSLFKVLLFQCIMDVSTRLTYLMYRPCSSSIDSSPLSNKLLLLFTSAFGESEVEVFKRYVCNTTRITINNTTCNPHHLALSSQHQHRQYQ